MGLVASAAPIEPTHMPTVALTANRESFMANRTSEQGSPAPVQQPFIPPLFRFCRAFDHPIARFGNLRKKSAQRRAEMLRVAIMRAHAGAQFRFVDELVGVGAVLERRLSAQ